MEFLYILMRNPQLYSAEGTLFAMSPAWGASFLKNSLLEVSFYMEYVMFILS